MALIKQSTARNRLVLMVDSGDHVTGKTGLTLTIRISKNGAAFATISPVVSELEAGFYSLALTASDADTLGDLGYHITGAGADSTDFVDQVVVDLPGSGDSWSSILEGTFSASDLLRIIAAVAAGKTSIDAHGNGGASVSFRDISDATTILTAEVSGVPNQRTSVLLAP